MTIIIPFLILIGSEELLFSFNSSLRKRTAYNNLVLGFLSDLRHNSIILETEILFNENIVLKDLYWEFTMTVASVSKKSYKTFHMGVTEGITLL